MEALKIIKQFNEAIAELEAQAPKTCDGCRHTRSLKCFDCVRYAAGYYYEPKDNT